MKYGKSEDNRENGTILDRLLVIKIWSDNKQDFIKYIYSHDSGEHGPYTAYVPKGQIARLGLKEGSMYRIVTKKTNGRYHWISATQLKKVTSIIERKDHFTRRVFYRLNNEARTC